MSVFDTNVLAFGIGAYTGSTALPFARVDGSGGKLTALSASVHGNGAGTAVGLKLVTFGTVATGGTPAVNGTIGAFAGTIVFAAGVVHHLTISNAVVPAGCWIGVEQTSGTAPTVTLASLNYVVGR